MFTHFQVRNENILLTVLLLVGFLLLSVFYLFKFFRFVLQNCPQCLLTRAIDMLGGNPLITARNQEYEHLALIAAINFITTVVLFVMLIIVALNYKKGLGDHFRRKWENKPKLLRHLDVTLSIPYFVKKLLCFWREKGEE
jgi:hypothetical protein